MNVIESIIGTQLFGQKAEKESGFFDLDKNISKCHHPSHEPPTHIFIPQGKGYRHVCPCCGETKTVIPQQIRL